MPEGSARTMVGASAARPGPEQAADLLIAAATTLHGNGQEAAVTQAAVERFGGALGRPVTMILRWGEIILLLKPARGDDVFRIATVAPNAVGMNRVVDTMAVIDGVKAQPKTAGDAGAALKEAAELPPSSDLLFFAACVAGAVMLALISGARRWEALLLIAFSAGAGALTRRIAARYGAGPMLQPFLAAMIAGLIGALAVRWQFSSMLRLVAVAPCMILVPGPHILNGAIDLLAFRIPLAASRLAFAALVLMAIGIGLLIGLAVGGGDLPPIGPGRAISLWVDAPAAAVVAVCYGVFYSMPLRMLIWPATAGAIAHAAHWWAMSELGFSAATAAGVAGLVAATILVPVVLRYRLPFAGIGFASVVSLMPGALVFRMMSGVFEIAAAGADIPPELINAVLTDTISATFIVLAMTLGLAVPKGLYEKLSSHAAHDRASA